MTMTQRYAGALRRHAHDVEVAGARPLQAEMLRQAARHMEEQQAVVDAALSKATTGQPELLTPDEVDQIANDGRRNALGGVYATQVHSFAEALQQEFAAKNGIPLPASKE